VVLLVALGPGAAMELAAELRLAYWLVFVAGPQLVRAMLAQPRAWKAWRLSGVLAEGA
jgi:hypothetical protein